MSATHSSLFTHAKYYAGSVLIAVAATSISGIGTFGMERGAGDSLCVTKVAALHDGSQYVSTVSMIDFTSDRPVGKLSEKEQTKGPDITAGDGITIGGVAGGGGTFVRWGDTVTVTKSDAFLVTGNKFGFNFRYEVRNAGSAATAPAFTNRLRVGETVLAQQTAIVLKGTEARRIESQGYLPTGTYVLKLSLDDGNKVPETDETNNVFTVTVAFTP